MEVDPAALVPGAIGSLTQLDGATFTQNFAADQQITQLGVQLANNRTFTIPEGFEAVAVQLEFVPGVAGYVSPGDRINLFGTVTGTPAELVLTNVEVLDVDLTIPPRRGSATDPDTGTSATAATAPGLSPTCWPSGPSTSRRWCTSRSPRPLRLPRRQTKRRPPGTPPARTPARSCKKSPTTRSTARRLR